METPNAFLLLVPSSDHADARTGIWRDDDPAGGSSIYWLVFSEHQDPETGDHLRVHGLGVVGQHVPDVQLSHVGDDRLHNFLNFHCRRLSPIRASLHPPKLMNLPPEAGWASVAVVVATAVLKIFDKWFHKSERMIESQEKESALLYKDRASELKRLYARVEEMGLALDKARDEHFEAMGAALKKDAEIRQLKERLAVLESHLGGNNSI